MKPLHITLLLSVIFAKLPAQTKIELVTKIDRVTVFTEGAQIFRAGTIELPAGKSTVFITALSPYIDAKSIQVKSPDNVMMLSVSHELMQPQAPYRNRSMDSLTRHVKQIDIISSKLGLRKDVIDQTQAMLLRNQQLGNQTTGVSVDQLKEALILFERSLMQAETEKWIINRQIDSLDQIKSRLLQQMNEIRGAPILGKGEIQIVFSTDMNVKADIEISYVVKNAGWHPRYDIRAKDITQPVHLVYKADVYQQTGEKWDEVKLKFSTGSPYERQTAPDLSPWKLTYRSNTVFRRLGPSGSLGLRTITGRVMDSNREPLIFANVMVDGHNLGTQTDLNGNFSILVPPDANNLNFSYTGYNASMIPISGSHLDVVLDEGVMLGEVTVTGFSAGVANSDRFNSVVKGIGQAVEIQPVVVIENQIITEFELDILASVPSDGKTMNLELEAFDIPADYIYESTPKADVGAYLIASLTDWEKYHLMEGEANLYFKNTFIGKTIINPEYLHDTLELSLGRDPDIVIKRIKEEEFTKKTFLGSNTIVEKSFRISIRNKKQYPVRVLITDQIPVSVNEAIMVSPLQLSGGVLTESSGLIKWRLNIDKEQTKDLILNYSVKYPTREYLALE